MKTKQTCPICLGRKEISGMGMMKGEKCKHCEGKGYVFISAVLEQKFEEIFNDRKVPPSYKTTSEMKMEIPQDLKEFLTEIHDESEPEEENYMKRKVDEARKILKRDKKKVS